MSGHRSLAFRLYAQFRDPSDNFFVSPYGLWAGLAMLCPGAGSGTEDQLHALLGIDDLAPVADLGRELKRREELGRREAMLVQGSLTHPMDPEALRFRLSLASQLWLQADYSVQPAYCTALSDSLGIEPRQVDFAGQPDSACSEVNRWVSDATSGRIQTILSPVALSSLTRALLTSAIYFKAPWANPFDPRRTESAPFHHLDGSQKSVPTMRHTGHYAVAGDDDVEVIELPYINQDVVMDIIAPRRNRFATVDRALSMVYAFTLLGELAPAQVDLHLPRFAIESDLRLADALGAMGATDLFSSAADFTALSAEPGFHLDDVLHKTFITVDEHGTEAAAVTMPAAAGGPGPEPITIRIDRPFYLLVRDVPSNAILFFGRCLDPGQ